MEICVQNFSYQLQSKAIFMFFSVISCISVLSSTAVRAFPAMRLQPGLIRQVWRTEGVTITSISTRSSSHNHAKIRNNLIKVSYACMLVQSLFYPSLHNPDLQNFLLQSSPLLRSFQLVFRTQTQLQSLQSFWNLAQKLNPFLNILFQETCL